MTTDSPYRFGLGTLFAITTTAAMLAGALTLVFPEPFPILMLLFLAVVAVGQTFLFRGKAPRIGSMLAGACCFMAAWLISVVRVRGLGPGNPLTELIGLSVAGACWGYLGGMVVHALFVLNCKLGNALRLAFHGDGIRPSADDPFADECTQEARDDALPAIAPQAAHVPPRSAV